jgi:transposase
MSDEEWACLEPFVIERGPRSGRRPRNHRLVLDGIFWIARTGVAWRDLHEHFGKWSSVYRQLVFGQTLIAKEIKTFQNGISIFLLFVKNSFIFLGSGLIN